MLDGPTQNLTHRFTDDGPRTLQIIAINEDGSFGTTKLVNVTNVAPTIANLLATTWMTRPSAPPAIN